VIKHGDLPARLDTPYVALEVAVGDAYTRHKLTLLAQNDPQLRLATQPLARLAEIGLLTTSFGGKLITDPCKDNQT
jgi:hypothetical protein